ncbi:helix-turn-helix domain-containing protein [Streptomyces thinghirensis]|nr:helix-turn-helix domain-containing protein [Streptomyces thinghirensis]
MLSVCSGVFVLGAAGLLDGRRCAVHWHQAAELARQYPRVAVAPDVLYVDEDPVITSAGTAAGIDACLHIVRKEQGAGGRQPDRPAHGRTAAPGRRSGAVHRTAAAALLLRHRRRGAGLDGTAPRRGGHRRAARGPGAHVPAHLRPPLPAGDGYDSYRWILRQRVLLAQRLLEATDETMDAIAWRTGFGTAAALRHQFVRALGTTPHAYRRAFRGPEAVA